MKYSAYYIQARLIKYFEETGNSSIADIVEKCTPVSLSEDKFVLYIEDAYVESLRKNAVTIEKAIQLIAKNIKLILWNDAEYQEYKQLASRPCDYTLTFSTLDIDAFSEADLAYYKKYANELHTESPFLYIPNIEGTTAKHLLHAIANYLYDKKPNRTIQISTGDRFVDEVISSEKTLDEYALDCYYNANVVLISDIQFVTKNDIARRTLSDIISYRIRNKTIKKITVLTSNDKSDVSTLRIPIGVSNCGVLEQAEIIDKPWQHILVAGHAGSGKSNYLHTVLASLLLNYSADQVNLWLSDGGMCEFNRFTDNAPAHIKRVNTSSDSASYIAFVDALEIEIDNRLKHLASVEKTSYYACYQEMNQCFFPRLVVMIDGFDHFVRCLFDTNHYYVEKMEYIVRRASTCGITFIVSIQEALFLAQHISRSFFELFGIRIATKQSPDSYAVLFGVPTVAMEHNIMLGDAIVNLKLSQIRPQHLNEFYMNLSKPGARADSKRATPKPIFNKRFESLGISKQQLARESGVSPQTISAVTKGDTLRMEKAEALADAMGMDFKKLFDVTENLKPLSPKTIREHHLLISTILGQAEKEMILPYNPAAKATPPKVTKSNPEYYQPDEMDEILEALEHVPIRWKAITYLLIDTGCRRGEVMGLKWEKLNLETGLIVIDTALLYSPSRGVYESTTKTNDVRAMILAPQTIAVLREWKQEYDRWKELNGDRWQNSPYVFVKENGGAMHPDSVTDWLGRFSKANTLPHIHPHAFRHTAASTMILNGVDMVSAAAELGHASPSTTANIYAHQFAIARAKAASVRAGVFANRK